MINVKSLFNDKSGRKMIKICVMKISTQVSMEISYHFHSLEQIQHECL